jgi:hypothetical protein
MPKIFVFLQIIIGSYLGACAVVFILNGMIPFPPLDVEDFVVNRNSEVIIFSHSNNTFYIYSPDYKVRKRFKIPESQGVSKLAIDENNNIYEANGGFLIKYDMNGARQLVSSVSLGALENWRLTPEGKIEYFAKPIGNENKLFSTKRLRRVARLGDILFFETSKSLRCLEDPFVDENGIRYVCKNWYSGIKIFNRRGELIKTLGPPFFLKPFALPFPGSYLWVIGLTLMVIIQFMFKNNGTIPPK